MNDPINGIFAGGLLVVAANTTWIVLAMHYMRKERTP
jgi:hypothetical protein